MHYGCGSRRASREVLFSNSFSCRYSIYISLLKTFVNHFGNLLKSFLNTRIGVPICSRLQVVPRPNSFLLLPTIPWSKPFSFTTIPWSKHFQSHFFSEILSENKTSTALQKFVQPVHNRGHGYSNRFTLCRGCTLYPHHSGTLP